MRKYFFVTIAIFATLTATAQKKIDNQLEALYKSEYFKSLDLVVDPSVYLLNNGKEVVHIEFYQDSANIFNECYPINASISAREGFENTYSIGTVYDYMIGERMIAFYAEIFYKDGSKEKIYRTIAFDNIIPPAPGTFEDAQYMSTEIYEFDGIAEL